MKTAVIYARYSCDNQTEQSIEGQIRVCKEYAEKNDIIIVDTYIDRAMSGTNDNRVAFQKMICDSAKKQWQYVIVYRLDRFSRNKIESVIHKKTLRDNGVMLLSAMEQISDTPEGRMLEAVIEGVNQYFSEELTQKVKRGLRESWNKGNSTGSRLIFGYDRVDKKYVINEYESAIIVEAFTKYAQGYKAIAIAEHFKQCGYRRKNGMLVDEKYLYYIFHNKRYTGVVEHDGVVYDQIFPRIISDDLWERVHAITEENKAAPSRKKEIYDFILSGKLICGDCKHKMCGVSGTSHTGDIYYYYQCLSRKRRHVHCSTKVVQKQYLEDLVIDTTTKMLSNKINIRYLAQEIHKAHTDELTDKSALKLLERQKTEAMKAQTNIIRAIEQGIITEATKSRLSELEAQIQQYDVEIAKEKSRTCAFLTIEDIEAFLKKFVFADTKETKIRKLLVNAFVREVILYNDRVVITYNITDNPEHVRHTKENVIKTEEQIEHAAKSAFSFAPSSNIISIGAPRNSRKIGSFFLSCYKF